MSLPSAIARIEDGLKEDPRVESAGGQRGPRDYLFTQRVVEWVRRLAPSPSDSLLLAAWGHDLYRWRLPRESQPMTTAGYHKWRRAQSDLSANEVEKILKEEELSDNTILRVRDLILKKNFPDDPESRALEDADCLAFLELKLESYLSEWEESKLIRILQGTVEKMSPPARKIAAEFLGQKAILKQEILDKILSNII